MKKTKFIHGYALSFHGFCIPIKPAVHSSRTNKLHYMDHTNSQNAPKTGKNRQTDELSQIRKQRFRQGRGTKQNPKTCKSKTPKTVSILIYLINPHQQQHTY